MTQQELLASFVQGDLEATKTIYRIAFQSCKNFILNNSGNEQDAEDEFREALIILYRNAYKPDFQLTSTISTYLNAIVRNRWYYELRKRKKNPVFLVDDSIYFENKLAVDEIQTENLDEKKLTIIEEELKKLTEVCRSILEDFYYRNISLKKLAERLDLHYDYMKLKKHRCLNQLISAVRERLNDNENG